MNTLKISREIKTAILVILSIVLFFWGYNFLKGKNLFDTSKKLYAVYESVEGLEPSSAVKLKGVTVGRVNSYEFLENKKVVVEISITSDYPISKTSIAELASNSFLGGNEIVIIPNDEDSNLAVSGDYLQSRSKLGFTDALSQQIEPLKDKIEKLLDNSNALFTNVNEVLDENSKNNLRNSIANLNATMNEFKQASKSLNELLANNKSKLDNSFASLDKTMQNFSEISDSLKQADLGKTIENLQKTLASVDKIMSDIQEGKGSMGKLMKDEEMYNNFTKASKELELLLQDLRLHPTRYVNISVFGKKDKPYVAPEEENNKTN